MNPRILLIGEAPGKDPRKQNLDVALACKAIGHHPGPGTMIFLKNQHPGLFDFAIATKHVNLLQAYPGPKFPIMEGEVAARRMIKSINAYDPWFVLLAGRAVAQAFAFEAAYFEDTPREGRTWAMVPHPSGRNTWWHDAQNKMLAVAYLKQLGKFRTKERA